MAQYGLGLSCYSGRGMPLDHTEAAKWFRMAAEQGYENAQYLLGRMYSEGDGVVQDDLEAYAWAIVAASNGNRFLLGQFENRADMKHLREKAQGRAKEIAAQIERRKR